jgi:superoxide reductase
MSSDRKFYRCSICGNIVGLINDGGGELVCCGQPMNLLLANTSDGAKEKHVPVGIRQGDFLHVTVGSIAHPMMESHYIQWICVAQSGRTQRAALQPGESPEADFAIMDGPVTIYDYCNLHGLWKADLD